MSSNFLVTNTSYPPGSETFSNPIQCLDLKPFKTERIKSNRNSLELNITHIEQFVIFQIFSDENPREAFRSYYCEFEPELVERIKSAWEWEAEDELIATAKPSNNSLIVMGCDLKIWEVPFKSISCFDSVPVSERANFKIDRDGSYLYWQCAELHVDLEDLRAAIDPEFRTQLWLEKSKYNKSLGKAIATVRKAHHLNQSEIEGLSDRHLRRIENEGYQLTLEVLQKLATAHKMNLEDYLVEVTRKMGKS